MAWIWTFFLLISLLSAVVSGHTADLSGAVMTGAGAGVRLAVELAGPICLWSGLAKVMEQTGWTAWLAKRFSPLLGKLFPKTWTDSLAREALCANFSANLLGLGNAATPMGIRAARRMALSSPGQANDELCRLVVMNTASIQLIPTTVSAVRASLGCRTPFDILPAVWITSIFSVMAGLLAAKVLSTWVR